MASSDVLTRTDKKSDFTTDASVRKAGATSEPLVLVEAGALLPRAARRPLWLVAVFRVSSQLPRACL